ncbi:MULTISPECIES: AMP-binding protein [unclassified Nocardioides]|uniref:AMP-binding protein n=1 Tax=unclassified Nocardioides TaxID=2615069 RepID=UPI0000571E02|nr:MULTISPECIES: AMP-binding protein [unclassified Nocardioides]ABL83634.1 AMP-dependent synthetase and ligase [Nocardioides sp. JS614]
MSTENAEPAVGTLPGRAPLTESYWPADTSIDLDRTTVGELLRRAADQVPDRIALVDGTVDPADRRRWTYAELLEIAEQVADALLARFEPGERLAIWEINRPEWVMLQLGAALAGVVVVTVNPQYRIDELRYVLEQAEVSGIAHGAEHRGVSMNDLVAHALPAVPRVRHVIRFDDWERFLASGTGRREFPDVSPDDDCMIIYTSGTTGFAKGALLHHLGVVNASSLSAQRANFRDGDCWINPIPLFHTGGGVLGSIGTLARRGRQVVVPQFEPGLVLDLIENEGGNLIVTVPTILIALLDHPDRPSRDLSSMRTIMCGGAKVPEDLVRRTNEIVGCDFSILFGQAEMHGVLTQSLPTDSPQDQATTLGIPLVHVEVKVADPVTGEPVPIGQPGEICARGYQTMREYFRMDEATAATIDRDGWLRSGDVGTMDERGYLQIAGRIKDIIIRGGENIHPLEIEELLIHHPGIAEVAVIGIPDSHWGEQVAAVVRANGAPPTAEELHAYCRASLAPFKTPKLWYFVDEFPMTPSGKIRKVELRSGVAHGSLGDPLVAAR